MLSFLKKLFKSNEEPLPSQEINQDISRRVTLPSPPNVQASSAQTLSGQPKPDHPVPFGYKIQWLAIQTDSVEKVIEQLSVTGLQRSNWANGIESAYEDYIFITPPVKGGVLVIGNAMPSAGGVDHVNEIKPVIERLSKVFDEVHYYGSHRVVNYYVWAKASNGRITRAFGSEGDVFWEEGTATAEERALGFRFGDVEAEDAWLPSEEDVLAIAKRWSIDPQMKYSDLEPGVGYIGKVKSE
ncbi:hypothetical protein [Paenibacillus sp. OV219]|uniref:hypothetical protein n=1 Tax=Paenibacillus sp. OV219 TaxID=1884377 RepID=UPI0008BA4656|nr:hypothetical protein [Paenibacillus sp. OV219]SEO38094.1 hypothetical protein SAMN05518847_107246 [Paenibacillus sp. OV219]